MKTRAADEVIEKGSRCGRSPVSSRSPRRLILRNSPYEQTLRIGSLGPGPAVGYGFSSSGWPVGIFCGSLR